MDQAMRYNPEIHHRRSIRLKGYDYSQSGAYFVTLCTQNRECLFGDIQNGVIRLNDAGWMVWHWYAALSKKFTDIECDEFVCMPNHVHFIVVNVGAHDVGADRCVCPGSDANIRPRSWSSWSEHGCNPRGEHVGSPLRHPQITGTPVGADRCVCPVPYHDIRPGFRSEPTGCNPRGEHAGSPLHHQQTIGVGVGADRCVCPGSCPDLSGEHGCNPRGEHAGSPLHRVVQWFKTMSTNEYIRGVKQNGWPPFSAKLWQRNYWEHVVRNETELDRIRAYIRNNPARWQSDQLHQAINLNSPTAVR